MKHSGILCPYVPSFNDLLKKGDSDDITLDCPMSKKGRGSMDESY